jgi:hypothetical protein
MKYLAIERNKKLPAPKKGDVVASYTRDDLQVDILAVKHK